MPSRPPAGATASTVWAIPSPKRPRLRSAWSSSRPAARSCETLPRWRGQGLTELQAVEIPQGAARRRCGMSCKAPKPRPGWTPGLLGQRRRSPAAPAPEGLVQNRALAAPRILRGRPARAAIRRTPIIPILHQRDPLGYFNSLLGESLPRFGRIRRSIFTDDGENVSDINLPAHGVDCRFGLQCVWFL